MRWKRKRFSILSFFVVLVSLLLPSQFIMGASTPTDKYTSWAKQYGILLVGTNQEANDLYYDGFQESLIVDLANVSGIQNAMEALMLLPTYVLRAMEPQYNHWSTKIETKAIYFSTKVGRGYACEMPYGYSDKYMVGCYAGFVLEQKIIEKDALHEFGHIVRNCGIKAPYYWEPIWGKFADELDLIFDAKGNLISRYASTNPSEDFAEHFTYYVTKGATFRDQIIGNLDLQERYNFLKQNIFEGTTYEDLIVAKPEPEPTQPEQLESNPPDPQPAPERFGGIEFLGLSGTQILIIMASFGLVLIFGLYYLRLVRLGRRRR